MLQLRAFVGSEPPLIWLAGCGGGFYNQACNPRSQGRMDSRTGLFLSESLEMDPDLLKEHGSGHNAEGNARTLETDEVSMSGSHKPEEEIMGSSPNDPKGRLSRHHTYEIVVDDYNTLLSECPVSRLPEHCGDNVEGEILLVESEEASCSEGSSEEYLEESADMEDSDDEDEEGSYNRFHLLPEPVPTIKVAPVKSPLQLKFPNLNLPSSHAAYLLQPADKFQPHDKFLAALTDMGISSRAATKALFWTGNCCLQTAAEWCFSNPGREMELLSLEEEVAMWLQDLEIQEAEIEAYQAALLREMMVVEEEEKQMRMRMLQSRNMQMGNRFVEVVESGEKQEGEVIVIEDDQCGGSSTQQVFLSPGGDLDSSEEEEDYLDIPGVVLFINFKVYASVCEVGNTSLSIIESDCLSGICMGWSGRRGRPESRHRTISQGAG